MNNIETPENKIDDFVKLNQEQVEKIEHLETEIKKVSEPTSKPVHEVVECMIIDL